MCPHFLQLLHKSLLVHHHTYISVLNYLLHFVFMVYFHLYIFGPAFFQCVFIHSAPSYVSSDASMCAVINGWQDVLGVGTKWCNESCK